MNRAQLQDMDRVQEASVSGHGISHVAEPPQRPRNQTQGSRTVKGKARAVVPSSEADEEDFDEETDLEEQERRMEQYERKEKKAIREVRRAIFTGEQLNLERSSSVYGDDEGQGNVQDDEDDEVEEEPVVEDVVTHKRVHYEDEEDDHDGASPHKSASTFAGQSNSSAAALPTSTKSAMKSPPPPAANRSRQLLLKAMQSAGGRPLTPTESDLSGSNFSETHRSEKERRARINHRSASNTEEEDAEADAEELGETPFREGVGAGAEVLADEEEQAGAYDTNDQQFDLPVEEDDSGVFRLELFDEVDEEENEVFAEPRTTGRLPEDLYRKGRKAGEALRLRAVELSERYSVDLHTVFKIMQLAFDPPRTSTWNDFLQWFKQMRNDDKAFAERNPCNGSKRTTHSVLLE